MLHHLDNDHLPQTTEETNHTLNGIDDEATQHVGPGLQEGVGEEGGREGGMEVWRERGRNRGREGVGENESNTLDVLCYM